MKHKVSELDGALLDYLVARAEGHTWRCPWMLEKEGMSAWQSYEQAWGNPTPSYSRDWAAAGPIIERERPVLEFVPCDGEHGWYARARHLPCDGDQFYGKTMLIAAMRCYVTSKLGHTVDLPE